MVFSGAESISEVFTMIGCQSYVIFGEDHGNFFFLNPHHVHFLHAIFYTQLPIGMVIQAFFLFLSVLYCFKAILICLSAEHLVPNI